MGQLLRCCYLLKVLENSFAVNSSDLKQQVNEDKVYFDGAFCPIHPGRLLPLLQDHDSNLLRLQLAHLEPPSGAGMARRQRLG
jgi:hypothetical protein